MAGLKPLRTVCGFLVLLSGEIPEQSVLKATFCWYAKDQALQVHAAQRALLGVCLLNWLPIAVPFVAMLQAGQMIGHRLQTSRLFPVSWFFARAVSVNVRSVDLLALTLQLPEPRLTHKLL